MQIPDASSIPADRGEGASSGEGGKSWTLTSDPEGGRVTVVFDGYLDAEAGVASAAAFRAAFTGAPREAVWDVTRMAGFDGRARSAWAEAIWPIRGQIRSLRVIGAKGIVKVGAMFLAVLLRKPYEFVEPDDAQRA